MKRMPSEGVTMAYMDSLTPSDEVQVPSQSPSGLYAAGVGAGADGAPPDPALPPGVAAGSGVAPGLPAAGGVPALMGAPPFVLAGLPPAPAGEAAPPPLPEQAPIRRQEERIKNV